MKKVDKISTKKFGEVLAVIVYTTASLLQIFNVKIVNNDINRKMAVFIH